MACEAMFATQPNHVSRTHPAHVEYIKPNPPVDLVGRGDPPLPTGGMIVP
jgi:hypothetical protein